MHSRTHLFATSGLGYVANQLDGGIIVHSPTFIVRDEPLLDEMAVRWELEVGGHRYLFDLEASLRDHAWETVGFDEGHHCTQHGVVFRCTHLAGMLVPGVVAEYRELDEYGARLELHLGSQYDAVVAGMAAKLQACDTLKRFSGE